MAGIVFSANGQTLNWRRDDVNMFALHLEIPKGVQSLEAKVDFLATAAASGFSAGASTGPNLAVLSWNEVALYPDGAQAAQVQYQAAVKLPADWKLATALTTSSNTANTTSFEPVLP